MSNRWADSVLLLLRRSGVVAVAATITFVGEVEALDFALISSLLRLGWRGMVEDGLLLALSGWPLLACRRAECGACTALCLLGAFGCTACLGEHGRDVQLADTALALLTEVDLGWVVLALRLLLLLRRLLLEVAGRLGLDGAVVVVNRYPGTPKTLGELSNLLLLELLLLLRTPLSGDAGQLLTLSRMG